MKEAGISGGAAGFAAAIKAAFNFKRAIEEKDRLVAGFRQSKYKAVIAGLKNVTFIAGRAALAGNSGGQGRQLGRAQCFN